MGINSEGCVFVCACFQAHLGISEAVRGPKWDSTAFRTLRFRAGPTFFKALFKTQLRWCKFRTGKSGYWVMAGGKGSSTATFVARRWVPTHHSQPHSHNMVISCPNRTIA